MPAGCSCQHCQCL